MDDLRQDIRFAIRSFARRPAFALSAVLSLAFGIAASSAVFSIINAALFKPLPGVTTPERLVEISRDVQGEWTDVTWEVFERLRQERTTLADLGAFALVSTSIAGEGEPVARADYITEPAESPWGTPYEVGELVAPAFLFAVDWGSSRLRRAPEC